MRAPLAWLLIVILSTHWMGGYLCFQLEYLVEVKNSMSSVEKMISEVLAEEMGAGIHVDIVDEQQLENANFGYSGRFIFSEEINGQVYHFEIISDPVDLSYQKQSYSQSQQPGGDHDKAIAFEWRFSKFTLQDLAFPSSVGEVGNRNYYHQDNHPISSPSVPTPPPKRISQV